MDEHTHQGTYTMKTIHTAGHINGTDCVDVLNCLLDGLSIYLNCSYLSRDSVSDSKSFIYTWGSKISIRGGMSDALDPFNPAPVVTVRSGCPDPKWASNSLLFSYPLPHLSLR